MAEKVASREEKLAPVIAKAWKSEGFRKQLKADPKGVIAKEFGVTLPANVSLEVLEESSSKLYLVLPAKPSSALSDDQLEAVAGGLCVPAVGAAAIAGAAVGAAGAGAAVGGAVGGGRRW